MKLEMALIAGWRYESWITGLLHFSLHTNGKNTVITSMSHLIKHLRNRSPILISSDVPGHWTKGAIGLN